MCALHSTVDEGHKVGSKEAEDLVNGHRVLGKEQEPQEVIVQEPQKPNEKAPPLKSVSCCPHTLHGI